MSRYLPVPRERLRRIIFLAVPIIGAMVSQNVFNLVDSWMVGQLGDASLAAVGMGSFLNFFASAILLGLGAGVQATASRRVGEGRAEEAAASLNGGLLLGVLFGVPWAALLFALTPWFFPLLVEERAVTDIGIDYFQARVLGLWAIALNVAFRGYWNATDRPWVYMRTLLSMHVVNIVCNYALIFGVGGLIPPLGATGAGYGSAIASIFGALSYALIGLRRARDEGFLAALPPKREIRALLKLSAPASVQQVFFAGGLTAFMWILGQLGTRELAAGGVLINITLVGLLPALGFGLAATSLVGQALGRRNSDDARAWGWQVATIACIVVSLVSAAGWLFPDPILQPFLRDPITRGLAVFPLRITALVMGLDAIGVVTMNALIGAGATGRVMTTSIAVQWVLFLPAAYLVGPVLGGGIDAVYLANACYRLFLALAFSMIWTSSFWERIRL